jgi:hypothetical protein
MATKLCWTVGCAGSTEVLTPTIQPYPVVPSRVLASSGRRMLTNAPVAQLDRATGFEPVGRGFNSLRARQP